MRFVRYRTTSLETSHQHTLHAEPDLGIPIDLIDPSTYKATPGTRPAPLLFFIGARRECRACCVCCVLRVVQRQEWRCRPKTRC
jgi:hypothetical protein